MRRRSTVVTGLGIVSAAGHGVDAVWRSIGSGTSGLKPLTLFPSFRYRAVPVGQVEGFTRPMNGMFHTRGSRSDYLAGQASAEAILMAGLPMPLPESMGVMLGASVGGSLGGEEFLRKIIKEHRIDTRGVRYTECSVSADYLAENLGLYGPSTTNSTACSSSALALALAAETIESGKTELMLAGGIDGLCRLTLNGFGSLLLIDDQGCRPFDAGRKGMSLGEGAAMLILEEERHARQRGAPILARFSGWGTTCDAHHATAPEPYGRGALAAMEHALKRAGLERGDIDYVNAHGTGTRDNDLAESRALRSLFGESSVPPFSSTKRFFGHTLAAAGSIEAVVCIKALMEQRIPPNLGFRDLDSEIGVAPVTEFRKADLNHVMSNSFGFGGNNAALIFSRPDGSDGDPPADATVGVIEVKDRPSGKQTAVGVYGVGIISPAGNSLGEVHASMVSGKVDPVVSTLDDPLPKRRIRHYACRDLPTEEEIPVRQRRRLSRLQKMAVMAVNQSVRQAELDLEEINPERFSVHIGTGLGCIGQSAAFYENMFLNDEQSPMPATFIRSVHNAPAGQVAIQYAAKGLNSAPTQHEISFETALDHGIKSMTERDADYAVVGTVDEVNPYLLIIGNRWGWWGEESAPIRPFNENLLPGQRPLVGEGASAFLLGRVRPGKTPLARITMVDLGRYKRKGRDLDSEAETRYLDRVIRSNGIDVDDIGLVVIGANGWPHHDSMYREVMKGLERSWQREVPLATYKQYCGEHYSASGFGFALASMLVGGTWDISSILVGARTRNVGRMVLLYTLSPSGVRSITCIRP